MKLIPLPAIQDVDRGDVASYGTKKSLLQNKNFIIVECKNSVNALEVNYCGDLVF